MHTRETKQKNVNISFRTLEEYKDYIYIYTLANTLTLTRGPAKNESMTNEITSIFPLRIFHLYLARF